MLKPRKPKSQRLGRKIKKKVQDVSDDLKQARKRRKAKRASKKASTAVKETEDGKEKKVITFDSKRVQRLKRVRATGFKSEDDKRKKRMVDEENKPTSTKRQYERSTNKLGRKIDRVESRKKRASRTLTRIDNREQAKMKRKSPKFGAREKADASGPTSRNKSVAACQKGDKKCSQK
jgi:hypothetical protein